MKHPSHATNKISFLLGSIFLSSILFFPTVSFAGAKEDYIAELAKYDQLKSTLEADVAGCADKACVYGKFKALNDQKTKVDQLRSQLPEVESTDAEPWYAAAFWWVLKIIGRLLFEIAGLFFNLSSYILNESISLTLKGTVLSSLTAIDVGWKVVRDMCNMFYIFILLYIAIATILNMVTGNMKRLVANVIISALLINFSLFFTKVIIDAGNVLAVGFHEKMVQTQGGKDVKDTASTLAGLAEIQTVLEPSEKQKEKLTEKKLFIMFMGGALVLFVFGYVLIAAAIMMAIRTAGFVFLMIISPFAFLGIAMPKYSYFDEWLNTLVRLSLSAPILLAMLYLVTLIMKGVKGATDNITIFDATGGKGGSIAGGIGGDPGSFGLILQYIILIILLLLALDTAQKYSGKFGGQAGNWAKKGIGMGGGLALGGVALAGRQTLGAAGKRLQAKYQKDIDEGRGGRFARAMVLVGDKTKKSSFDVRGTKSFQKTAGATLEYTGVNVGNSGGAGGFQKTGSVVAKVTNAVPLIQTKGYGGEDHEKKVIEDAKRIYKNPEDQERYIRQHLGTEGQTLFPFQKNVVKDRFDAYAFKEERTRIANEKRKEVALTDMKKLDAELAAGPLRADRILDLRKNMSIIGKDITRVDDAMLKRAEIIKMMTGEQLSAINDASLTNPKMTAISTEIRKHALSPTAGGITSSAKEEIRKLDADSPMYIDFAHEIQNQVTAGNKAEIKRFVDLAGQRNIPEIGEDLIKQLGEMGQLNKAALNAIEKRIVDGIYGVNFPQEFTDKVIAAHTASPTDPDIKRTHDYLQKLSKNENRSDSPFYGVSFPVPPPAPPTNSPLPTIDPTLIPPRP